MPSLRVLLLMFCLVPSVVSLAEATNEKKAKRAVPPEVTSVSSNGIEYRAPIHTRIDNIGFVEAWDEKTGKLIWRRQVYVIKYNPDKERDVQDVFVTSLKLENDTLVITNEKKSKYSVDVDTLDVKVIKGQLVEQGR